MAHFIYHNLPQSTTIDPFYPPKSYLDGAMTQVHSGLMRFAELDAFVDGVLSGGPLEQKLQVGVVGTQGANGRSWEHPEGLKHVRQRMKHVETMI